MKILICTDSFKHSLTALEAGTGIAKGLQGISEDLEPDVLPLADGGEGTVRAMVDATGGRMIECEVHDPLMRPVKSHFGMLGEGSTAIIEMAAASGIEWLKEEERNPFFTTTYGTGEMIRAALDGGCRRIILGVGGSATIDGGAGMLCALGARFYNKNHQTFIPTGELLNDIRELDIRDLHPRFRQVDIRIASDVDNPLAGMKGAAFVYGPQKGAQPGDLQILDHNLKTYANLLSEHTRADLLTLPGTGAAGGLAISLLTFSRATLENGFSLIARELNLEKAIRECHLVITGEGKIDGQTRYGKTPWGVARMARKYNKPVIAVGGSIETSEMEEFDLMLPVVERPMTLENALKNAEKMLESTGRRIGRIILLSGQLDKSSG